MCDYVCLYVYIMFYYAYIQYSLNIYIYAWLIFIEMYLSPHALLLAAFTLKASYVESWLAHTRHLQTSQSRLQPGNPAENHPGSRFLAANI